MLQSRPLMSGRDNALQSESENVPPRTPPPSKTDAPSSMSRFMSLLSPVLGGSSSENTGPTAAAEPSAKSVGEPDSEAMIAALSTRVGELQAQVCAAEDAATEAEATRVELRETKMALEEALAAKAKYKGLALKLRADLELAQRKLHSGSPAAAAKYRTRAEGLAKEVSALKARNSELEGRVEKVRDLANGLLLDTQNKDAEAVALRAQLAQARKAFDDFAAEQAAEAEVVQEQMFFSTALALKLSFSMAGVPVNGVSTQALYDAVRSEGVPVIQWGAWLSERMTTPVPAS